MHTEVQHSIGLFGNSLAAGTVGILEHFQQNFSLMADSHVGVSQN